MSSKPAKPKASPSTKQCSLETFIHSSETDNCILITDTPRKVDTNTNSISPQHTELLMSPQLVLTPISLVSSPTSSKDDQSEAIVESKGTPSNSKAEELSMSLDALAIARKSKIQGAKQSPEINPPPQNTNTPEITRLPPITPPSVTVTPKDGNTTLKKQRRPRSKNEMEFEWEKLKEEKREVANLKREYEKKISDLNREKERLSKQIEKNEEREREKELKAQERDAKLKKKEEMLDLKNKERELKIKLKEIQLQEKENDRLRVEEERNRKRDKVVAEQQRFKNFFVAKPLSSRRQQEHVYQLDSRFVPFHIKDDMKLASLPCKQIDYEEFDLFLSLDSQEFPTKHLLEQIKCSRLNTSHRSVEPMESECTAETDIMIVAEGDGEKSCVRAQPVKVRFKLLQFEENRRPAYFGTFFKKSSLVSGRRPYGRDSTVLDYEVDSDEEWEPEDPDAESIKSNDSDEEGSGSQNDSDSEDGFFVPHGYLSEDEGHDSDAEGDEDDNENDCETAREPVDSFEEKRRRKLEAKQEAWLAEISQKCQPLKPFIISRLVNSHLSVENQTRIDKCTGVLLVEDPLNYSLPSEPCSNAPNRSRGGVHIINSTALPYFVQYIHEQCIGVDRAAIQFYVFWNEHYLPKRFPDKQPDDLETLKVSKRRLTRTIQCIANKVEQGFQKVWHVKEEYWSDNVLDVDIKQEIKQLFPSKVANKQIDPGNGKTANIPKNDVIILDSSSPVQNIKPVEKLNEIKKYTSPAMKFTTDARAKSSPKLNSIATSTQSPVIISSKTQITQSTLNNVSKPVSTFKRKSLSEMKAMAVKTCPETPLSPPDVEMSEIKRVKLSTSSTSISSQEILRIESPLPETTPTEPRRRLALGTKQVDSKGSFVHVWK